MFRGIDDATAHTPDAIQSPLRGVLEREGICIGFRVQDPSAPSSGYSREDFHRSSIFHIVADDVSRARPTLVRLHEQISVVAKTEVTRLQSCVHVHETACRSRDEGRNVGWEDQLITDFHLRFTTTRFQAVERGGSAGKKMGEGLEKKKQETGQEGGEGWKRHR